MKEKSKKENDDILRLTIVALLFALNFGALQYFESKEFDEINTTSFIKVTSGVIMTLPFIVFSMYVIALAISKSYKLNKLKIDEKKVQLLYDLGVTITVGIVLIAMMISFSLRLFISTKNTVLFGICLIVSVLFVAVLSFVMLRPYLDWFHKSNK